jgi:hypothetical protein
MNLEVQKKQDFIKKLAMQIQDCKNQIRLKKTEVILRKSAKSNKNYEVL